MALPSYSSVFPPDELGYEYRIVTLRNMPKQGTRILSEEEWRGMGITQSPGWQHVLTWQDGRLLVFRRLKK